MSKVRSTAFTLFALLALGMGGERVFFLASAKRTTGTVIKVEAEEARHGSKKRRRNNPSRSRLYTAYYATIKFYTGEGKEITIRRKAGSAKEQRQSIEFAKLKPNQSVPLLYDPSNPQKVYDDTLWGVWGYRLVILFIGFVLVLFTLKSKT